MWRGGFGCRVRETQALGPPFAWTKEKLGQKTPCTGLELYLHIFSLLVKETGEALPNSLVLRTPPQWFSLTSVLAFPFCVPSPTGQTQVLNSKFYLLSSWFWVIFPVPFGFLSPGPLPEYFPPSLSTLLLSPSNLWCLLRFPPNILHIKATGP